MEDHPADHSGIWFEADYGNVRQSGQYMVRRIGATCVSLAVENISLTPRRDLRPNVADRDVADHWTPAGLDHHPMLRLDEGYLNLF